MKRKLSLQFFAALFALLLVTPVIAQTQGNQGQGQTQQGGTQTGGTQGGGQTGQGQGNGNGTEDPIAKIRESAKGRANKAGAEITIDSIGQIGSRVNEYVTFRAVGRNAKSERIALIYSLKDAPSGAIIDPVTGIFSWTPTLAGTFKFVVIGVAPDNPDIVAKQNVTVDVSKPLELFGYAFFLAPRAAIMSRLQAIQQGLALPGIPIRAQGGAPMGNGLMPDGSAFSAVTNPANPAINFPPSTTAPGQATPPTTSPATTPQIDPKTGLPIPGTQTGTPPTDPNQAQTAPPPVGVPALNPSTQTQQPGYQPYGSPYGFEGRRTQADATKWPVGPFDMVGLNVYIPSPERYQLGAGDVITMRISSPTVELREFEVTVDTQGVINLPTSGRRIVVRGQTLAQAENALRKEVRRDVRDGDVTLSLKELRTQTIHVIGEAFLPGAYQVPAVMTLFNALYIFGGPTDGGSLRKIELRRTNGKRIIFDLYDFLISGDASKDVPLQPGDTIFIPPVESRATVQGEVNRPGIFEVLPGEKLKEVLAFAGNAKATGVSQRVSHSTVEPGQGLKLNDVDLNGTGPSSNPPVYGGDTIQVQAVRPELTNLVTLDGAVDQPGQYALTEGLTVQGLIQRGRGLQMDAYRQRADLYRLNDDKTITLIQIELDKALQGDPQNNPVLKPFDKLMIYRTQDVTWIGSRRITVRGAVRNPGDYVRADNMRVMDFLLQVGGLIGDAFLEQGFLQRFNADGTVGDLLKIDFRKVAVNDPAHNVVLQDRDVLTVQTVSEAQFVPEQQVQILGGVQAPGNYLRSANMTLKDLILLAGGLMPNAGEVIEVASARVPDGTKARQFKTSDVMAGSQLVQIDAGDLVTVPIRSDFMMDVKTVIVMGAVMRPGVYAINSTTDRLSDIISRAGGPASNAFLKGAQFVRETNLLRTLSQDRLTPRLKEVNRLVSIDEYNRAMARAEVDRMRISKSVQGSVSSDVGAATAILGGGVPTPKTTPEVKPLDFKWNPVTPARDLLPNDLIPPGNINVRLEDVLARPGSRDDLVMASGDIIVVPELPSTVSVIGAVVQPSALLFVPNKPVSYYIDRCGGFTIDVAKDRILVIRANGEVVRANARTKVDLGDVVFAPTKVMAERLSDRQADIDAISKNVTSAGVIFAILKSLLGF